ncbi:MAG TPA: tail fiber protein [Xanthomonadales bacterium]|jgi:microcystin-dependent protein|nr:tail fiber protein [Xanthomonadales bacterium]
MSSPFVAEIRIVGFNFAPAGWAFCNGQLLPLSQNTALFSLLGTFYGGNGKSNFALPDFQGNAPMHQGQGPGLSEYFLGEQGGASTVSLLESEIPSHSHTLNASDNPGERNNPATNLYAVPDSGFLYANAASMTPMSLQSLAVTGGDQPHNNMPPYLVLNFIIALQGVFPPRS